MNIIKQLLVLFVLLTVLVALPASASGKKLFVNLTSDDTNRAAMAVGFATKVLQKEKIPVTILLNVDAVRLADKNIPQNKYANDKTVTEMLAGFMKAGGKVIMCPMCMKNVGGMEKSDLIPGLIMGGPDVTFPAMLAEGTTVISY
ncbi:MAG: DsrE family protein [Gammaproteobacteria bacterium]|nr:DsrE family protein [Gammaproteobacteria bacterium]